ncbi:PaaI family thioesterase [Flavihumibacter sp. UBA7668]|uniref:PaaI family thioesterase n=1 Tax=Flavihumibacter sp. UBA7668 TaxID=1946542 RepID=UPI0025B96961|nr:PaaI family thioesterase [Flavihumibacter sp. UBA7668]
MKIESTVDLNQPLLKLQEYIGQPAPKGISPVFNWLAPQLTHAEAGHVRFDYTISKEWLNPMQTLHGGVMATIMDDAIGVAVFSLGLPTYFTTINLSVDYFVPANPGEKVSAKAEVIKAGRQVIHAICEVRHSGTGKLLARATSNLMKTSKEK